MSREAPNREGKDESSLTAQLKQERAAVAERNPPSGCQDLASKGFRFDDPYWDDAFDSWHNPTLRTCCRWC